MNNRLSVLIVSLLALCMFSSCTQSPQLSSEPEVGFVADQKYWGGKEGNASIRLVAKFDDRSKMGEILNLNQFVMNFASRQWFFCDIVIRIDLNSNGQVAIWDVSGPKPVIEAYMKLMTDYSRKVDSGIYDYGTEVIQCLPAASISLEK